VYMPTRSGLGEEERRLRDAGIAVEEREEWLLARDPSSNAVLLSVNLNR